MVSKLLGVDIEDVVLVIVVVVIVVVVVVVVVAVVESSELSSSLWQEMLTNINAIVSKKNSVRKNAKGELICFIILFLEKSYFNVSFWQARVSEKRSGPVRRLSAFRGNS